MIRRWLTLLALLLTISDTPLSAAEAARPGFQPPGMWNWDNWFVQDHGVWHAFYLQLPQALGEARRWQNNDPFKHVGHAISTNLFDWQDQGPALFATPGTWNDRHIATGSIIQHDGRWWMFFTGRGTHGDGVGLATSTNLQRWEAAQPVPLFPLIGTVDEGNIASAFTSQWQGQTVRWTGISDPYVLPESHDGWFYIVICARVVGAPLGESGCLARLKSRDLLHWEEAGLLTWPHCFERMETPQLWPRHGHWYLSFGGVLNAAITNGVQDALPAAVRQQRSHLDYYYVGDNFDGPFKDDQLHRTEAPGSHYIMKVLPQPGENDVAIFTQHDKRGTSLSPPFSLKYLPDGRLACEPLAR